MESCNFLRVLVIIYFYFGMLASGKPYARPYNLFKGDTIRITTSSYSGKRVVGIAIDVRKETLFVQVDSQILHISRQNIKQLEVARGRKSNTTKGLTVGAFTGGLGLGLVAAASVSGEQDAWFTPTPGQALLGGMTLGGLLGGLTGAIIGSGSETPRWVKVPLEQLSLGMPDTARKSRGEEKKPELQAVTTKLTRKWRLSFTLGTTSSGPAGDLEQAMRRDGWDETLSGGWLGGPVEQPSSKTGFGEIGAPFSLQVSYSLNRKYDGVIMIAHNPIGFTDGHRSIPAMFLSLQYYSTIISPMLVFKPGSLLHFGLGPAWFINKIEQESVGEIIYSEQKSRPGVVLTASLIYPSRTRFFINLDAQYHWTPEVTFGPFRDSNRGISQAQLNPFKANFSHTFVGFGIGIRL